MPELTPIQSQVLAGLLAGGSIAAVAREHNVHRLTVYNWRHDHPVFAYALTDARRRQQTTMFDAAQDLASRAFETLGSLLTSQDEDMRLRAAQAILRTFAATENLANEAEPKLPGPADLSGCHHNSTQVNNFDAENGGLTAKPPKGRPSDMTQEQLGELILSTAPAEWISDYDEDVAVCARDLNVRIALKSRSRSQFPEKWASDFPDPKAYMVTFVLWYGASPIKKYALICVDGGRAYLPMPKINTMEISREQFAIACAVNQVGASDDSYFLDYIQRFTVVD